MNEKVIDPEEINNIASAIQSILVSIAVLVGGVWTLFSFKVLNVKKKAEAELAELHHRLSFKPLINISVNVTSHPNPAGSGYLVSSIVLVENVGTRDTSLFFPENRRPFYVTRVIPMIDGNIELGAKCETGIPLGDSSDVFSRGSVVRAGAKVELPFVVHVPEEGVYLVCFSTYPSVEERDQSIIAGAPSTSKITWTGRAYVVVNKGTEKYMRNTNISDALHNNAINSES